MKYLIILLMAVSLQAQWNNHKVVMGDKGKPFSQDASTEAINTITYEHHEIHAGSHYFVRGWTLLSSDGDSVSFALTTPNTTKWTHMVFEITGGLLTEVKVFKSATVTGGDTITPHNSNQNYPDSYSGTVIFNPTWSVEGTCIDSTKTGATGGSRFGGTISRSNEVVLKQNTTYLYHIITGANTNYVHWNAEFYEHTDRQ